MHQRSSLPANAIITCLIGLIGLVIISSCNTHSNKSQSSENIDDTYILDESSFGQRKTIKLPDSTFVILNSDSRLKLPQHLKPFSRELTLDGDAFFKIFPYQDTPLIIHTGMLDITSQGASFRIRAHKENAGQSMELLQGTLTVAKAYPSDYPDTVTLHAGKMILINKDIDLMEKETFDSSILINWRNGILTFDQTPFNKAIRKLEDWYGVEIEVKGDFSGAAEITATFNHKSLQETLDSLSASDNFNYKIKDNKVSVYN